MIIYVVIFKLLTEIQDGDDRVPSAEGREGRMSDLESSVDGVRRISEGRWVCQRGSAQRRVHAGVVNGVKGGEGVVFMS